MMKKIIVIFFLLKISNIGFSQSDYTFKKIVQLPFGGQATGVKQSSDGGYVVCGSYEGNPTTSKGNFLMKLSKDGLTLWYKEFPYLWYRTFYDLTLDSNDNIYISGVGDDSVYSSFGNVIVIKTNPLGSVLWSKSYGGFDSDLSYSIDYTSDNNILASGHTQSYETSGAGVTSYTIKLDLNGNLIWSKFSDAPISNTAYFVKEVYPNKYVTVGRCSNMDCGGFNVFDNSGNLLTSKNIVFSDLVWFSSVTQYDNGGYLIAGSTAISSGPGNLRPFLVALDSNYNFLWAKKYLPPISLISEFISINRTMDGNYITSFEPEGVNGTQHSLGLMKLDSNGAIIWGKLYEQNDHLLPFKMIEAQDGGYMEVGYIQKSTLRRPIIIKTDNLGVVNGCVSDTNVTSIIQNVIPSITLGGNVFSACVINNIVINNNTLEMLDSVYCVDSIPSTNSIEQYLINNEVIVYPNPVLLETTFSLSKELKKGTLNIFDVTGKKISSKDFSGLEVNFNRSQLPSGMYFYTIGSENKIIAKGKLIFR